MKGEIDAIRQILNEDLTVNCYEIVIDMMEKPDLKLGSCEIRTIKK